jgi:HD-like signal output (HDOD) protein/ActR/RegA family two-component response regulator
MTKKNLLIVDDEPKVVQAIRQLLLNMGDQWTVDCATSAAEALQILALRPINIIISDLVMPGMDGAQLLSEVMLRYPHTTRIIMCWQADQPHLTKVFGVAHQYLYKPCDAKALRDLLNGVLTRGDLLKNNKLQQLVSQLRSVPSLPSLYCEVMKEMKSADASLEKAGQIIERDPGMSAKILQLVNSAFFGIRRHISSPEEAIFYLGIETVKALVLSLQIFSRFDESRLRLCHLGSLWTHSWSAGVLSRHICAVEDSDKEIADHAFVAGLVHDIGKLVLAANLPDQYRAACLLAKQKNMLLFEAEKEVFGATHAEVGGFLLDLWGLPDVVVDAVAFHHAPSWSTSDLFTPLTALHAADVLDHDHETADSPYECNRMDLEYLARLGLTDRFAIWQASCWDALDQQKQPRKEYAME